MLLSANKNILRKSRSWRINKIRCIYPKLFSNDTKTDSSKYDFVDEEIKVKSVLRGILLNVDITSLPLLCCVVFLVVLLVSLLIGSKKRILSQYRIYRYLYTASLLSLTAICYGLWQYAKGIKYVNDKIEEECKQLEHIVDCTKCKEKKEPWMYFVLKENASKIIQNDSMSVKETYEKYNVAIMKEGFAIALDQNLLLHKAYAVLSTIGLIQQIIYFRNTSRAKRSRLILFLSFVCCTGGLVCTITNNILLNALSSVHESIEEMVPNLLVMNTHQEYIENKDSYEKEFSIFTANEFVKENRKTLSILY